MTLNRVIARTLFYPSLGIHRLMCGLGIWDNWSELDAHVLVADCR